MLAGRQQNYVLTVVDVIERIPSFGSDTNQISLAFERQQVLANGRRLADRKRSGLTTAEAVFLVEERERNIETRSVEQSRSARLREHRTSDVEAESILVVVRPRSRIQVEYDVVDSAAPPTQRIYLRSNLGNVFSTQPVSVQCIDT